MSNQPVIPATQLAPRQLEALVFGDAAIAQPPVPVAVPREQRDALAGTYNVGTSGAVVVRSTPDALEAEAADPGLFGTFGALTPPGGRFAALETRSMAVLGAAAKDDFRPLFEAFSDDRPFEVVQGNQRRFWGGWRTEFGEFRRLELLGTGTAQGDPAVTVRLHFERGGPTLQLIWGPRRLAGFRVIPPAPVALVAESATSWVYYNYRTPAPVRLRFGPPGTLEIETAQGTVSGKRQ